MYALKHIRLVITIERIGYLGISFCCVTLLYFTHNTFKIHNRCSISSQKNKLRVVDFIKFLKCSLGIIFWRGAVKVY